MNEFVKCEEYGVAIGFRTKFDRDRYLNDPLTSPGFKPCTMGDAYDFVFNNGYKWGLPTTFYDGTLDGLTVVFSEPAC